MWITSARRYNAACACIKHRTQHGHPPTRRRAKRVFARGRQPANEGGKARTAPRPREPPSGAGARQRVAGGGNRGVPSERRRGDRSRKDGEGDDRETKAPKERSGEGARGARRKAKAYLAQSKARRSNAGDGRSGGCPPRRAGAGAARRETTNKPQFVRSVDAMCEARKYGGVGNTLRAESAYLLSTRASYNIRTF